VAEVCDYVIVMYAGKIAEEGPVREIFKDPKHPYTVGLLNSIPKLGKKAEYLPTIEGTVPSLAALPKGCRFQARCPQVHARCREAEPPLAGVGPDHQAACWLHIPQH
jgi:peptide/nickel transport system ATP-binding protein